MSFSFNEPTSTHPNATEQPTNATPDVTVTSTDSGNPDVVPPVGNDKVPEDAGATAAPPAGGEGTGKPNGEPEPTDPAPVSTEEVSYFFGDQQVEIEIPQDVSDALKEKGLDAAAVAAELYSKEGKFTLSEETKEKLYAAFGKFSVDAAIAGLRAQNEGFLHQLERDSEVAEKANAERFETVAKEVGGSDGWAVLERFALDTLSDDELNGFNEVMASGNQYLQMYAVRELESRRKAAQGDDKVTLVDGTSAASTEESGPLSAQGYAQEYAGLAKKYGNDRVARAAAERALDARRRAGIKSGL